MGTYISPSKIFAHMDRLAGWKAGRKPAPVTVEWDLSNACSLACQSCHFAHTHVAGPWLTKDRDKPEGYSETGRFADADVVIRALKEMQASSVRAIVWSGGGEPTLYPDLRDVMTTAHLLGLEQGMYTLGGHITPSLERTLRLLSWVVVSLDAVDAETYGREKGVKPSRFDDACEGIQTMRRREIDITSTQDARPRWIKTGPIVGVSFLLHAKNWQRAPEMLELARSLRADYATFRPTIETSPAHPSVCDADRSWVTDALPMLRALTDEPDVEISPERFVEYRDWHGHRYSACRGIRLVTTITPDGRVWVCPNRRGVPGSELGDLRTESFAEIWARHPGQWTDFSGCRVMCRLNQVNTTLAAVYQPRAHEAFV